MSLSAVAAESPPFLFSSPCLLPVRSHPTIASLQRLPSKPTANLLCHVSHPASASPTADSSLYPSSAAAVARVIRRTSPASPVEFTQRVDRPGKTGMVLPSSDFQRLCIEQLDLFRAVVDPHAVLSVYVRPAGSYVMDQLELRRVTYYPGVETSETEECIIVVGNFAIPGGLHIAEIAISRQEVEFVAELGAIVFPLVKQPFVVGFLVAEFPHNEVANCATFEAWESLEFKEEFDRSYGQLTSEKRLRAVIISRSLATAYVMDQKSMLLRQTSWQNNVRMSHLVEQIRGSLSSISALGKMLSLHVRSEIAYDIVEDILVQGDSMKDAIQQLQDAVYLTKANIVQFNEDSLNKLQESIIDHPEMGRALLSHSPSREAPNNSAQEDMTFLSLGSGNKDIEVPMPPLSLVPLQEHIRPCSVSDVLRDLVGAAEALASKQQRSLELSGLPHPLLAAVEESSLRQALSNLIEGCLLRTHVGGKVEIYGLQAPAGGVLIVIDDDGPDMHYMTQVHTLTAFGADLLSSGRVEDNMTWNFVAGLAVAREILESYGCVIRVISPRKPDAALGAGGTRIELWLPDINSG